MSSEQARFYQSYYRANAAAANAVPAAYRIADSYVFAGDERQSSASLYFEQPVNEVDILMVGNALNQPGGAADRLQEELTGIIMQDSGVKDPVQKEFFRQQKKKQIKAAVERYTNRLESFYAQLAEIKAFRKHEEAKSQQLRRMQATEFASSEGTSEQKQSSMEEIANSYITGPDDIATA